MTLKVVPCALSPSPENARTASSRTFGATPISLLCAAMAPAMAVPCGCGVAVPPSASSSPANTPARSGWRVSILRVDHRHHDVVAVADAVGVDEMQFVDDVLRAAGLSRRADRRPACKP